MDNNADHREGDEGHASDEEDTGAPVSPIIRLKEVAVCTGEEDEKPLLDLKAKLYRFDKDGNKWKERGAGSVKLLRHDVTGKVRLLMRQSKTRKICANHLIGRGMRVQEHAGNEKSCVWKAMDFSEDGLKEELFCIRFVSIENCTMFLDSFQEIVQSQSNEDNQKQEGNSNNEENHISEKNQYNGENHGNEKNQNNVDNPENEENQNNGENKNHEEFQNNGENQISEKNQNNGENHEHEKKQNHENEENQNNGENQNHEEFQNNGENHEHENEENHNNGENQNHEENQNNGENQNHEENQNNGRTRTMRTKCIFCCESP
ncbi:unnamed protein product [Sphenostylis stenocarpa]|uniref:RanBD1 domain-containing protein n=1 Tax=Sphenostylis stenocarpa TaxID=92480 RepID=A0AA86VHB5_9FABA|nr:unnamed protein product [Sphenostylis stenocarpa]